MTGSSSLLFGAAKGEFKVGRMRQSLIAAQLVRRERSALGEVTQEEVDAGIHSIPTHFAGRTVNLSGEAQTALKNLGIAETHLSALVERKSVAFNLAGAAEGTVCVAQLTAEGRLRVGIYTMKNEGGGLTDFLTFEARAQAAAKATGAKELELMGIEITNPKLRATLQRSGFTKTTMPTPDDLGGGTFTDVLSRVEPVK